jgi:hypothetical protein
MARPDGRIEKGQRLATAISARAWNRAQEAADRVLGAGTGVEAGASTLTSAPYQSVLARNDTGSDVPRWGVMAIAGFEVSPTSSDSDAPTSQFQEMPIVTGRSPSSTASAWCVAVEPIKFSAIGRVAVSGVVQIKTADLPKVARSAVIFKNSHWALIQMHAATRIGTIASSWLKGQTSSVTEQNGDGTAITNAASFSAVNHFADVLVFSGTKRVACTLIGSTWVLVAAEC